MMYWGDDGQECISTAALKEKLLKMDLLLLELEDALSTSGDIVIEGQTIKGNLTQ